MRQERSEAVGERERERESWFQGSRRAPYHLKKKQGELVLWSTDCCDGGTAPGAGLGLRGVVDPKKKKKKKKKKRELDHSRNED